MSKRELYTGAVLTLISISFFIGVIADISETMAGSLPLIELEPGIFKFFGWGVTIYAIGMIILTVWAVSKRSDAFDQLIQRTTYRATIPGYFIIAFVPVVCGLFLITAGLGQWGMVLSCTGFPAVLVFLLLAIWNLKREQKS